jgi:hypothetical protein
MTWLVAGAKVVNSIEPYSDSGKSCRILGAEKLF